MQGCTDSAAAARLTSGSFSALPAAWHSASSVSTSALFLRGTASGASACMGLAAELWCALVVTWRLEDPLSPASRGAAAFKHECWAVLSEACAEAWAACGCVWRMSSRRFRVLESGVHVESCKHVLACIHC